MGNQPSLTVPKQPLKPQVNGFAAEARKPEKDHHRQEGEARPQERRALSAWDWRVHLG